MDRALLILAVSAALAGCGRDQRSASIPAADSPPNPTEPASAPPSALAAYAPSAAPASSN